MVEKFWQRFEEAWRAWLPECADLADVARVLGGNYDKMSQWRAGRGRPQKKVPELAGLFEPLRQRGCDPHALATYVYMGSGEMPTPDGPVAVATQPSPRDPRRLPLLALKRLHAWALKNATRKDEELGAGDVREGLGLVLALRISNPSDAGSNPAGRIEALPEVKKRVA